MIPERITTIEAVDMAKSIMEKAEQQRAEFAQRVAAAERCGCDCCDPTSDSPDPVVVRLEDEVRVLQVGLAELGNRLLTLSTDPPRGYRLANQYGLWWLFDHRGEGVEWGDTLEALVRKLGGAE